MKISSVNSKYESQCSDTKCHVRGHCTFNNCTEPRYTYSKLMELLAKPDDHWELRCPFFNCDDQEMKELKLREIVEML